MKIRIHPSSADGPPAFHNSGDVQPLWATGDGHAHVPQKLAVATATQHSQHLHGRGGGEGAGHSHGLLILHPMARSVPPPEFSLSPLLSPSPLLQQDIHLTFKTTHHLR